MKINLIILLILTIFSTNLLSKDVIYIQLGAYQNLKSFENYKLEKLSKKLSIYKNINLKLWKSKNYKFLRVGPFQSLKNAKLIYENDIKKIYKNPYYIRKNKKIFDNYISINLNNYFS